MKSKDEESNKYDVKFWIREIKRAEGLRKQKLYPDIKAAWDEYLGRQRKLNTTQVANLRRLNVFWAIINTASPAFYSRTPAVEASLKEFRGNDLDNAAAQLWENATTYSQREDQDFDDVCSKAVLNYLIGGEAVLWETYEVKDEEIEEEFRVIESPDGYFFADGTPVPDGVELKVTESGAVVAIQGSIIQEEKSITECLHYEDYLEEPSRGDPKWKAKGVYLDKDEVERRYGEEIARDLKFAVLPGDLKRSDLNSREEQTYSKARIWEVYCKSTGKRYVVAPSYEKGFLEEPEVPAIRLKNFFPCSIIRANVNPETNLPCPDHKLIFDQLFEIERLTDRIHALSESIRTNLAYDETLGEIIKDLFDGDLRIIPTKNWPRLKTEGGIEGAFGTLPIRLYVDALEVAVEARNESLSKLYEITGNSDLVRGHTAPSETATAQQMKGNFYSLRASQRQREFQKFISQAIQIKGEIIVEKYSEETLYQIGKGDDIQNALDPNIAISAIQLLKNDGLRRFRLNIDTDSMVAIDQAAERQQRVDFMASAGSFLQQLQPVVAQNPQMIIPATKLLLFVMRSYRAGKELEDSFEQLLQSVPQPQGQPTQGLEEQAKTQVAQINAETALMKAQHEQQLAALDFEQARQERELAIAKLRAEYEKIGLEYYKIGAEKEKAAIEAESEALKQQAQIQKEQLDTEQAVIQRL